ncbi:GAF domain-containing protein [Paenarthrobacter sp. YJN-5]|uniref:GAF domain-containing protein n=1 Tax=Paenarthrobacter sp. YJN-5 TaxID=2735316 RepID=UPI001877BE3D|nr:GAF domain-containing protein [Paenarthrobacter sp. YJN-5]QOT19840.1 GAF domain-containing protein [Paenarthrobacter sp. YJN-5]
MKVRAEHTAEQLQRWLHAMAHFGAAVNSGVSLKELLDLVAQTACELMSYDFCAITLPDKDKKVLLIEGSYGLSAEYVQDVNAAHPIRLRGVSAPSPSSQAFALGVPVQVRDISNSPGFSPWRTMAKEQGFTSVIAVPLISSGETIGTMICYTRNAHDFTHGEESLLSMLADEAAIAITTNRLRAGQAKAILDLNDLNASMQAQHEARQQADDIHRRLTALTLDGAGMTAVLAVLVDILNRPVSICDPHGRLLCSMMHDEDELPASLIANRLAFKDPITADDANSTLLIQLGDTEKALAMVGFPVMTRGEILAWVWTSGLLAELSSLEKEAVERAASVLGLELLRSRAIAEIEWRKTGDLVSALLLNSEGDVTRLTSLAVELGHDLTFPHAVLLAGKVPYDNGRLPRGVGAVLATIAGKMFPRPLFGLHDAYVTAFWPLSPGMHLDDLRSLGDEIRIRLAEEAREGPRSVYSALAGPVTRVADFQEVFATARGAIELASMRQAAPATLRLTGLGIAEILLRLPDLTAVNRFVDDNLSPLREFDAAQESPLSPTLMALIRHNLDLFKVAEQLGVEATVIAERQQQIEKILSVRLTDLSDLRRLSMALEIEEAVHGSRP